MLVCIAVSFCVLNFSQSAKGAASIQAGFRLDMSLHKLLHHSENTAFV